MKENKKILLFFKEDDIPAANKMKISTNSREDDITIYLRKNT